VTLVVPIADHFTEVPGLLSFPAGALIRVIGYHDKMYLTGELNGEFGLVLRGLLLDYSESRAKKIVRERLRKTGNSKWPFCFFCGTAPRRSFDKIKNCGPQTNT